MGKFENTVEKEKEGTGAETLGGLMRKKEAVCDTLYFLENERVHKGIVPNYEHKASMPGLYMARRYH